MDLGIWAVWYDLPEEGADEYISCFMRSTSPKRLRGRATCGLRT